MPNTIQTSTPVVPAGEPVPIQVTADQKQGDFTWMILRGERALAWHTERRTPGTTDLVFSFTSRKLLEPGGYELKLFDGTVRPAGRRAARQLAETSFAVVPSHTVNVHLVPHDRPPQRDVGNRFITFSAFREVLDRRRGRRGSNPLAFGGGSYEELREAAQRYVRTHTITDFSDLAPRGYEEQRKEAEELFKALRLPRGPVLPGVELIWNYWEEEGMLVQTLNVILARFQNRRLPGRDPLARFDVTPLLPLRGILWGFAEDEVNRMTVRRRAAEYEYEYGLALIGRAVPPRHTNVERRSAFLASFHQVIHQAHQFFRQLDDLTINADPFPLYRALRDCHLVLSQGSHNQYGEMAVAARAEFLVMQQILAEPQMREFLGGRPMTPYPEPWMDRVDTMKSIQGWDDTSIMHYHDLATLGEQLVLTIRLGNWVEADAQDARNWAIVFRQPIQQYAAAYRSVTDVDLSRHANAELPAALIQRRLTAGRRGA